MTARLKIIGYKIAQRNTTARLRKELKDDTERKYKNVLVGEDGARYDPKTHRIKFDSKAEYTRWCALTLMEKAGLIEKLEVHPKWDIVIDGRQARYTDTGRAITFSADFAYIENGQRVVEDVKSPVTAQDRSTRLSRSVAEHIYHFQVRLVDAKGRPVVKARRRSG